MSGGRLTGLTVLKLGGELLENADHLATVVAGIAALAGRGPAVVVHGGGKDIDAETARRGLAKHAVDGLRVTDAATLDAVVAALAGTVNTRLVAALSAAGVPAVGLTGADALAMPATVAPPYRAQDGRHVDLGLVGDPDGHGAPQVLVDLLRLGYVPVMACIGCTRSGQLLNVNADTAASHLARALSAARLVIAGATDGVLDRAGRRIDTMDAAAIEDVIAEGTATAGMVAKLTACRNALAGGVTGIHIVDGRVPGGLADTRGTRIAGSNVH